MIDFQNSTFVKLHLVDDDKFSELVTPLFVPGEKILSTYQGIRDGLVFTDKRIIAVNVEGIVGKKKDFTSLPYGRIQAFSVETAGVMDLDSVLSLCITGIEIVRFEFESKADIYAICRMISERVL